MSRSLPIRPARIIAALAVSMACCVSTATAQQSLPPLKGRSLQEALRILQREGLRIVFSSEAVTADMRVREEPRARRRRAQLDQLLEPHGLKAVSGPGPIIQIVAKRNASSRAVTSSGSAPPLPHLQAMRLCRDPIPRRCWFARAKTDSAGSSVALDVNRLQASRGTVDDVLQAMQALPRVASVDDYRGEFSVRGSPYRHVGSVIDGDRDPVAAAQRLREERSGIAVDVLQRRAAERDASCRRVSSALRRSARRRTGDDAARGLPGVAAVSWIDRRNGDGNGGEGPLGEAGRGSWIVSLRNSYLDWPVKRPTVGGSSFAFADAHAKLVYNVSPSQQLTFTALGGRSRLDSPDDVAPSALAVGTNDAMLFSLGWRTSLGARGVIRQSVAVIDQRFSNAPTGRAERRWRPQSRDCPITSTSGTRSPGAALKGEPMSSRLDGVRDLRLDRGIVRPRLADRWMRPLPRNGGRDRHTCTSTGTSAAPFPSAAASGLRAPPSSKTRSSAHGCCLNGVSGRIGRSTRRSASLISFRISISSAAPTTR